MTGRGRRGVIDDARRRVDGLLLAARAADEVAAAAEALLERLDANAAPAERAALQAALAHFRTATGTTPARHNR